MWLLLKNIIKNLLNYLNLSKDIFLYMKIICFILLYIKNEKKYTVLSYYD